MILCYKKKSMADPKPVRFLDLKMIVSGIMALTALVTAITSLVKAVDKRVEQASYEALAQSIKDMQTDQANLRVELMALQSRGVTMDWDGDGIPDDPSTLKCDVQPSSSSAPINKSDPGDKSKKPWKPGIMATPRPAPSASGSASTFPSAAMALPKPPPTWKDVLKSADKL